MSLSSDEFRFHDVVGVTYEGDHVLTVRFDDGFERTIDFEPILLGPLFGPLRDLRLFRQARVDPDLGTIVWPTGEQTSNRRCCTIGLNTSMPSCSDAGAALERRRLCW